ncbi:MAG TPA: ATP-grasp domain-containing protein [Thermoanaerobaculia bacterium]|jgi:biotin carboxylase
MKKTILLMGGANVPAVREAAERRGYDIIAINFAEAVERLEPEPSIIHAEGMDFANLMGAQRRLIELHRHYHYEAIVPTSEYGLLASSMAARALGLPYTPLEAVANTRDKVRMRRVLESKGLAQVRFRSCTAVGEVRAFLDEIGGPIIVKPLLGTGSDGVSRVDSQEQVENAWRITGAARSFGGVICEEYIDGPEFSIEAYLVDGEFFPVAITDKQTDARFLEIGHSQPTLLSEQVQQQVFDKTREILLALGITHGVTHTEMRVSPTRGPVLIETHTRMGGDLIHVLSKITTGVDLADLIVACSLGERPNVRPRNTGTAAAVRFVSGPAGVITSMDVPAVDEANGVRESRPYVGVGHEATGRSATLDRFGHVLTTGATRHEADARADETVARFRVTVGEKEAVAV